MMGKIQLKSQDKNNTFLFLLLGGICLAFSQGRWSIPLAAFGYFIFMLRFLKVANSKWKYVVFVLFHTIAWDVAYTGLIPIPFPWRLIISFSFSLIIGLLFWVDCWANSKTNKFYITLLLPAGFILFEFLIGVYGTGTGASIANTFGNQIAFAQIASVTGWTGITFIVCWTATVVNWFWKNKQESKSIYEGLIYYGFVIVLILIFGHTRLWKSYSGETIRIASVVGKSTLPETGKLRQLVSNYLKNEELLDSDKTIAQNHIRTIIDRNFQLAEQELIAGTKIVVFPEANPAITHNEERYCIEKAKKLSIKYEAYLGLGLYVFNYKDPKQNENKFMMLAPDGAVVWEFYKANLVPGSSHKTGNGILPVHEANFGKLSAAICYDMDFPALMQQAGKQNVDILFGPSNDWPAINEIHVRMAKMRAIEQGYSLVRPTGGGFSFVTDPYGRIIAYQNTNRSGEYILTANVFTKGVTTIYSIIGNTFSWLCIIGFFFLLIVALIKPRR